MYKQLLGSSGQTATLSLHLLTHDVHQDGADDNQTQNDVLNCGVDGQQCETVTQDSNDQAAQHGADHGTLTTG